MRIFDYTPLTKERLLDLTFHWMNVKNREYEHTSCYGTERETSDHELFKAGWEKVTGYKEDGTFYYEYQKDGLRMSYDDACDFVEKVKT